MGYLAYDGSTRVSFDDRVLAHLEVVIVRKLRRHESFAMTWRESSSTGSGRSTIWLDNALPLRFRYHSPEQPTFDRDWLHRLAESANSNSGLLVVDENGEVCAGITHDRGIQLALLDPR
jgi:hypothetical protein